MPRHFFEHVRPADGDPESAQLVRVSECGRREVEIETGCFEAQSENGLATTGAILTAEEFAAFIRAGAAWLRELGVEV